ncbi:zinc finger CCCH domain-containing protein 18 isoform X2 [Morus notabilis]|uniref:zinc finger CCCH domain-containing protein 18 isoform X2 n=1 Tax=Morus notabilis TaxID=981085 RepID=UPI000CED38FC|nr:zinc finger CCCH domain-containing protein 18 isoform X2 [Morus notabilis]
MDFSESTKIVYNRIQKLEPENVSKIIGYLLLQDHGERDMIRLAFSPDNLMHSLITRAKTELGLSSKSPVPAPISPSQVNQIPVLDIPLQFQSYTPVSARPNYYWDHNAEVINQGYVDSTAENFHLQNQLHLLSLEDPLESACSVSSDFSSGYYYPELALGLRASRRSPSLSEFPVKVCHYFNKGHCKHGTNCKYFHGHPLPESFPRIVSNEVPNDEQAISPGTLERLEMEIVELLRSRIGSPVSIASLPMMYYEKYGRSLQAEGYLTESQRHGKTGYSLTKLLARLKHSIRIVDRPHGQHSVILAEDVPRYLDYAGEKNEPGVIVSGSRQIYLTFPAESTFTEQDVSNYFNKFGPVQDVRIPCQQKRMFGFVTFVYPETVRQILSKGNPHFVCGARVLVKPYREKSRLVDRKFAEKMLHASCCDQHFMDGDSEFHSLPRDYGKPRFLRKHLMLDNEEGFKLDRRCFSEMNLTAKPSSHRSYYGYSMDELKLPEEQAEFPYAERFSYLLDVLNNASTSEEKELVHISTKCNEQDSQGLNLPESPFASAIGSGILTVT